MVRKSAFTLIELLVVISIIALLMAIFLPALSRVRKQAKAVICLSHLKQWGTTFALYTEENEGHLPGLGATVWLMRGAFASEGDPNEPRVGRSIRTQGIACCPTATKPREGLGYFSIGELKGHRGATFRAWQLTSPAPPFLGSYGLNRSLDLFTTIGSQLGKSVDTYSLRNTARIPAILDSVRPYGGLVNPFSSPPRTEFAGEIQGCIINRHNGCINGLFLDWSVRPIGIKELWTLKWCPDFETAGRWTRAGGVQPADWPEWIRRFKPIFDTMKL